MIDLGKAEKQRPETYRPPSVPSDPIEAFHYAMMEYGLDPGHIEPSGKLIRFNTDRRKDRAGWYIFFVGDICAGAFGNWATDLKQNWCAIERSAMTDEQSARYRATVEAARKQREEEEARLHAEAKIKANEIWNNAKPADPDHPYLKRKGVPCHSLRQSRGDLVMPVMDADGTIHSLQFIWPKKDEEGKDKKFLFGGAVEGHCFTIIGNERLYICEGYATGASIHAATGGTVICAFNAGNIRGGC